MVTVPLDEGKTLTALQLDTGIFVDADSSDNKWQAKY
jgi:hypothetical protein